MNNLDRYLKQDLQEAVKLTKEYWQLSDELQQMVTQNNLEGAKEVAISMVHIVNELEYMQAKKKNYDILNHIAIHLKRSKHGSVNAEVVWRNAQDQ